MGSKKFFVGQYWPTDNKFTIPDLREQKIWSEEPCRNLRKGSTIRFTLKENKKMQILWFESAPEGLPKNLVLLISTIPILP